MKMVPGLFIFGLLTFFARSAPAQDNLTLDWAELGKTEPWKASEQWEPKPVKVTPGRSLSEAPSDAIVLFDGRSLDQWHTPALSYGARMDQVEAILNEKLTNPSFEAPSWIVKDGTMIVNPGKGAVETKESFGSCQLHIEWLSPAVNDRVGQGYSNSGIFLMGLYEVQILNSYENETYPNGQAASIYKQHIPDVNASRPPGEWQTYDIVFEAPTFDDEGELVAPAALTLFHNGVLVHNAVKLEGPCVYIGKPYYINHPDRLPLLLQDHGDPVRFRNIWIRDL